jgi:N-glycosylase/DNA lyase
MKIAELLIAYKIKKNAIRQALKKFGKPNDGRELFIELCYCLCTPQSKAENVYAAINDKHSEMLLGANKERLSSFLRGTCRFHKNKAGYIINSRKLIPQLERLPKDPRTAREWLVKNVKGLGYKEASHFLRNIGYRNIAILDRHVLNSLHALGVLKDANVPTNGKRYEEMEHKLRKFSERIGIDMDELDLLLWSMKTGKILK